MTRKARLKQCNMRTKLLLLAMKTEEEGREPEKNRWPLEAEKGKKTDSPRTLPERIQPS